MTDGRRYCYAYSPSKRMVTEIYPSTMYAPVLLSDVVKIMGDPEIYAEKHGRPLNETRTRCTPNHLARCYAFDTKYATGMHEIAPDAVYFELDSVEFQACAKDYSMLEAFAEKVGEPFFNLLADRALGDRYVWVCYTEFSQTSEVILIEVVDSAEKANEWLDCAPKHSDGHRVRRFYEKYKLR